MPTSKNQKNNDQNATTSKELEVAVVDPADDEIDEIPSKNIYDKIYEYADKLAATHLGQEVIEKTDRLLKVVEKTAKWSLPQKEPPVDKGISAPVLERPCSWIPFLSLIVALRVVRVGLSFGSILIGNRPVSPSNMVYFIQSRRRRLRAIKYRGLRAIRMKNQIQALSSSNKKQYGLIGKLSSIINMLICRPGIRYESTSDTQVIVKKSNSQKSKKLKTNEDNHIGSSYKGSLNSNETSQKRPLDKDDDSETDDEDLPVDKLLDKYGAETSSNIDEDPDFIPDSKSDSTLTTDSELSDDNEELRHKLNELKRKQEEIIKNIAKNSIDETTAEPTTSTSEKNCVVENENKNVKELKCEKEIHSSETNEITTTSVTINPTKMSPKIAARINLLLAQNGNADEEKFENFYDTLECGSDDTEQKKGSSQNFYNKNVANNIAEVNQNLNVKKMIENRENCTFHVDDKPIITTTDDTTNNENFNDNHIQSSSSNQQQLPPHSHQHNTNSNQTKQPNNNKKYYNSNNSNHNSTYKYTKGKKIH